MGLVKTRRLAAMQKQTTYAKATVVKQRAKAGMKPSMKDGAGKGVPHIRRPSREAYPPTEGRC